MLSAGVAYNHAFIDELDPALMALGLSGDSQSGVVGLQYQKEPIYIATTFARHKNHETTDQQKYFDATGWELYARYNVSDRFRVIGGANVLEPDDNDSNAGQYEIRSAILGLQYNYASDATYGDILYLEVELRGGRNVDGSKQDNAFTVGARYSFEY